MSENWSDFRGSANQRARSFLSHALDIGLILMGHVGRWDNEGDGECNDAPRQTLTRFTVHKAGSGLQGNCFCRKHSKKTTPTLAK